MSRKPLPFLVTLYYNREMIFTGKELRFIHKIHAGKYVKRKKREERLSGFTVSKN